MSRGSFGRTVARAAASGGSKSYRARPPMLWYVSIVLIVVAGIGLIVYSRNEALHKASASTTAAAPTKTDNWYTALGFDVCGTIERNLPTSTNLSTAGIRTFGDGIVNTNPGSVADSSRFTGAHATLGTFVSTYGNGLQLSSRTLVLPKAGTGGAGAATTGAKGAAPSAKAGSTASTAKPSTVRYTSGSRCTSGPDAGKRAVLETEVWDSPSAAGHRFTGDPSTIKLANGQMITVAFVPAGSKIPAPRALPTLLQDLGKK